MKHKPIFWLSLTVLLAGLGAAAHSYSGPNRTVTTTHTTNERRVCYWEASHPDLPSGPTCYLQLYYAPGDSCPHLDPVSNQGYFSASACRQAWHDTVGCPASGGRLCSISGPGTWIEECSPGQSGCTSVKHTSTTTLPPATVSGSATCGQPGSNGWCLGAASLNLSASEPLSGYVITGIESSLGMLCSTNGASVSCSWAFPEGNTSLGFWALSSYGDTSLQASAAMGVDSTPPSLAAAPSGGVPGSNGWYVAGPLTVSAGASDATSGLAGTWGRLDGGEWLAGDSLQIEEEGVHSVEFRAEDAAGNASSQMTGVRLDTQPPAVAVSLDGLMGAGEWYISSPSFSVQASDATSGLGTVEIRLDGGEWQSANALQIPDGIHLVEARAADLAGNVTLESRGLQVDTLPPQSAFSEPAEGSTSTASGVIPMSGGSLDAASGLLEAQISLDGGANWQALPLGDDGKWAYAWDTTGTPNGTYTVLVRAADLAGNRENSARVTVVVSNPPPVVSIPERWRLAESAPVAVQPQGIPLGGARLTISDPRGRHPAFVEEYTAENLPGEIEWNGRLGDGAAASPREYPVLFEAWDVFGNTGSDAGTLIILPPPAPISIPVPPVYPAWAPLPTPTPTATATFTATATLTAAPRSAQTAAAAPSLPPAATLQPDPAVPEPQPAPPPDPASLWPLVGLISLLAALASASLSDTRPRALRRLGKTLESFLGKPF